MLQVSVRGRCTVGIMARRIIHQLVDDIDGEILPDGTDAQALRDVLQP